MNETSPKGFLASKCDVGNWILGIFGKFLGNFFGEFFQEFFENFSLGILW